MLVSWGGRQQEEAHHLFRDFAQQAFQAELRRNGNASGLHSLRVDRAPDSSGDILISATLESRHIWNQCIRRRHRLHAVAEDVAEVFRRGPPGLQDAFRTEIHHIFAIEREEVEMELQMRAAHAEVEEALRLGLPNDQLFALQQRYHERRREIQEHRGRVNPRQQRAEEMLQRAEEMLQLIAAMQDFAPMYQQRLADTMGLHRHLFGEFPLSESRESRLAAQERGLKLLKENLTPAQLKQYEAHNYFHVKGGDSGKTYRILHGRQINIRELDNKHRIVCKWCFLPGGALVEGDVMLAQKFGLELQESEVLKVANRFPPDNERRRESTQVWVDDVAAVPPAAWQGVDRAAPDGDRTVIRTFIHPRYSGIGPVWRSDYS